jgi:small subunit ribosomal protein S6
VRTYELVCIFPVNEEQFGRGREFIKSEFQKNNSTLVKEEDMGDRALNYPIKKQDRGHYYFFEVETAPEIINSLDRTFKLNNDVLKYLFVKKE